ncbi:UEV domain containing protein [Amanita muscaria]
MSSISLTHKWLRQNVQPYQNKDRVYADIDAALARFSTLRPKTDVYTYDDGRTQLLLCVHGLLPITFKRASYNIPVALWITREYPKDPPIAYVVPTNDMLVKPGRCVDVSGRCSPEYIAHWERKSEGCTLIALLEALQDQFSREPPLFSKPKGPSPKADEQSTSPRPDRPPLPPKPRPSSFHQSPSPTPYSGSSHATYVPSHVQPSERFQSPPRVSAPSPVYPRSDQAAPLSYPPWDTGSSSQAAINYQSAAVFPGDVNVAPRIQPDAPQQQIYQPLDQVQPVQQAPPRPPNPELLQLHSHVHDKIKLEISTLSQGIASDTERLRALQADLLAGEPAIRDEMGRLEAVRDVCCTVSNRLHDSVGRAESNIAELRRRGDPDIDEMVCATTIVHNQLINLTAEDNAIEDTIYQLHRALNAGRIDLDRFLRTTRVLAEEQFMKRALIEKITIGIPKNQSGGPLWS